MAGPQFPAFQHQLIQQRISQCRAFLNFSDIFDIQGIDHHIAVTFASNLETRHLPVLECHSDLAGYLFHIIWIAIDASIFQAAANTLTKLLFILWF